MRRLLIALAFCLAVSAAEAETLRIVAVGASNTRGWGVAPHEAYPARLQALLRQNGIDATVTNAGKDYATTKQMLKRLPALVPGGTHIVIIEPGRNDLFFFSTWKRRAARIREMVAAIEARGIKTIVYEPDYKPGDFQWDRLHLTPKAHEKVAADLLPKVLAAMPGKPAAKPAAARRR